AGAGVRRAGVTGRWTGRRGVAWGGALSNGVGALDRPRVGRDPEDLSGDPERPFGQAVTTPRWHRRGRTPLAGAGGSSPRGSSPPRRRPAAASRTRRPCRAAPPRTRRA